MPTDENPYRKLLSEILAHLFPYALVLYLIFYLLETVLPGFVTNNFSLNYFLVPTLIFGVLAVIFPQPETVEEDERPASKFDLILILAMSLASFFLIFYKFKIDNFTLKLTVSFLSSFLTLILGAVLLYFPEKTEEEIEKDIVEGEVVTINWHQTVKRLFLLRLRLPVPIVLVFLVISLIFIPKNMAGVLNFPRSCPATECQAPTTALSPTPTPLPEPDPNVKIVVYNGGAEAGEANRFAETFKREGFKEVEALNYDQGEINDVLIQFREEEASQADLVEYILRNEYQTIVRAPLATTSAEIRVVLGKQPPPASEFPDFENEDFDFFF